MKTPGRERAPFILTVRTAGGSEERLLARAVMAQIRRAATEVLTAGTYESLREQIPSPEANALFAGRAGAS